MPDEPYNPDYQHGIDISTVHAPVAREKGDPSVSSTPLSLWVLIPCALVVVLAGVILGKYSNLDNAEGYVVSDMRPADQEAVVMTPQEIAMNEGAKTFATCGACHGARGQGVLGNGPPLAGSEWVNGNPEHLAMIIMHGLQGPVTVKGQTYNKPGGMEGLKAGLSAKKLSYVMSYLRSSYGNTGDFVTVEQGNAMYEKYRDRLGKWTIAEILEAVPDKNGTIIVPEAEAPAAE